MFHYLELVFFVCLQYWFWMTYGSMTFVHFFHSCSRRTCCVRGVLWSKNWGGWWRSCISEAVVILYYTATGSGAGRGTVGCTHQCHSNRALPCPLPQGPTTLAHGGHWENGHWIMRSPLYNGMAHHRLRMASQQSRAWVACRTRTRETIWQGRNPFRVSPCSDQLGDVTARSTLYCMPGMVVREPK